jgi:hypothetical protein
MTGSRSRATTGTPRVKRCGSSISRQKKGTPNKISGALKEAILEAAEQAGGERGTVGYLVVQAHANPAAFRSLLGKVLPMTIAGTEQDGKVGARLVVEERIVWPKDKDGNVIRPIWWKEDEPGA